MSANLCLNMIVKNEAHVIERCLLAARPHVQRWCIVDTGSTDGTQEKIRALLAGIPGELHERPWRNFAHNRTDALELARAGGGHALFLDADDVLTVEGGAPRPATGMDAHHLAIHVGESFSFARVGIIDLAKPFRWEGVVHEYLECAEPFRVELLPGWHVRSISDSARNREGTKKYLRDAAVLEAALVDEPENARYVFYLAQSYRDGGRPDRALGFYEKRAVMGSFEEEAWYAQYQIGAVRETLGDVDGALLAYLKAFDRRPFRAETMHAAARLCRQEKRWGSALAFARMAIAVPRPATDVLFLDDAVYTWRSLDEYGVAASWTGALAEAVSAFEHVLSCATLPPGERGRIEANVAHCRKQLGR